MWPLVSLGPLTSHGDIWVTNDPWCLSTHFQLVASLGHFRPMVSMDHLLSAVYFGPFVVRGVFEPIYARRVLGAIHDMLYLLVHSRLVVLLAYVAWCG